MNNRLVCFKWSDVWVVLVAIAIVVSVRAGEPSNGPSNATLVQFQASTNVDAIIQMLPQLESLWTNDPIAYLRCMRDASAILSAAPKVSTEAQIALAVVYDKTMEKKCPTDIGLATDYFNYKMAVIGKCYSSPEIEYDKSRILTFAKFIGEVRSRIIQKYSNQGMAMPHAADQILMKAGVPAYEFLTNEETKLAFNKAMKDGDQLRQMDFLQTTLRNANGLKLFLLEACSHYPSANPTNTDFIKQVTVDARLTEEEGSKLLSQQSK